MRNLPIIGGRDVGPPRDWDADKRGECLTISVLHTLDDGLPFTTTAWDLGTDELDALRHGGSLWFADQGEAVRVKRLWVQAKGGEIVSDLTAAATYVEPVRSTRPGDQATVQAAALRAAVIALAARLDHRLGGKGGHEGMDALKPLTTVAILARFAELVDQVPFARSARGVVNVPVLSLDDVVRGAAVVGPLGGRWPFNGEPAGEDVEAGLRRELDGLGEEDPK